MPPRRSPTRATRAAAPSQTLAAAPPLPLPRHRRSWPPAWPRGSPGWRRRGSSSPRDLVAQATASRLLSSHTGCVEPGGGVRRGYWWRRLVSGWRVGTAADPILPRPSLPPVLAAAAALARIAGSSPGRLDPVSMRPDLELRHLDPALSRRAGEGGAWPRRRRRRQQRVLAPVLYCRF